jgi:hypothetical protein
MQEKEDREAYSRIEQPPTDPKEHPNIDHQAEPKAQRNEQQNTCIWCLCNAPILLARRRPITVGRRRIRDLSATESEEEEHESASELRRRGYHFVFPFPGEGRSGERGSGGIAERGAVCSRRRFIFLVEREDVVRRASHG